ncbi:MAG: cytochrome c3 family protein [Methanosarcina sp.]
MPYISPKVSSFIALLLFVFISISSAQEKDSVNVKEPSEHEDLVRGQRLFFGLVHLDNKAMNCSQCHSTHSAAAYDTVNWNPDALDISEKYLSKNPDDLSRVLLSPSGKKMAAAHNGFKLSPDEIKLIKGYMDTIPEKGLSKPKPVATKLILSIIATILFLASFIDIIFTKRLKRQWINKAIIPVTSVYLTWVLVVGAIGLGRTPGYSPDQPVKFSHKIHAGQNETACIYCHSYAPYSKVSGIPPTNVCMNCHLLVRQGTRSGTFEIAKVLASSENKVPIRWIQVHNLPDHVYFNHSQHVGAGKLDCRECHGKVEEMDRITQVSDLSMGWCINCHRSKAVQFSSNEFYSQYTGIAGRFKTGELDSVLVSTIGGTDCMKCHY